MKPSCLFGLCVAVWGVVIALPTIGLVAHMPWLVWVLAACWGVVYARRRWSLALLLMQAGSVTVTALISGYTREYFEYPLVIPGVVALSLGYMVLWMAPFGIASSYVQGGGTRPQPRKSYGCARSDEVGAEALGRED